MPLIHQPPVICYVAAKSGGHIMPALTLAQREKSRDASTRILFISSSCELDKKILKEADYIDKKVTLPLYTPSMSAGFFKYFHLLFGVMASFFKSLLFFWQEKPRHLVSMGGMISVPVCFAAMILRIPFDIWELNAVPGKAVMALKSFARTIYICFSSSNQILQSTNVQLATYPTRFNTKLDNDEARLKLGIPQDKKVLLVLGGSQGSSFMNHALADMILEIVDNSWFVIHQAGHKEYEMVKEKYAQASIDAYVFNFTSDLAACYTAADFVVARAGAGSIFEILTFNKKALLIPLHASTTDHQVDNAKAIVNEYPQFFEYTEQNIVDRARLRKFIDV